MNISASILASLENGDEQYKTEKVKENFQISSERNARIILNILENSPEKIEEKISKEACKLESKIEKEYKKFYKKMESYSLDHGSLKKDKILSLEKELTELKKLIKS